MTTSDAERIVACECAATRGDHQCAWSGPVDETVMVEWMPEYLRETHSAAGNAGTWPHNGAKRLRCEATCAERIVESEPEWAAVIVEGE